MNVQGRRLCHVKHLHGGAVMPALAPDGIKTSCSHSMRWVQQSSTDGFCPCDGLLHQVLLGCELLEDLCTAQQGANRCSGCCPYLPACKGLSGESCDFSLWKQDLNDGPSSCP